MKKLGFKASPSRLFPGTIRRISEDAAIKSKLIFSNGVCSNQWCNAGFKYFNSSSERGIPQRGPLEKFHTQMAEREQSLAFSGNGVQKVQKLSFSGSEDDFAELDEPDVAVKVAGLKLVTEKAKASLNAGASKKLLDNKGGRDASRVSLTGKQSSKKRGNHLAGHRIAFVDNCNDVPRSESETQISKNNSNYRNSNSITIEKVPPSISLSELRHAVSVYGEISNASMKQGPNGLNSCHVEFKSMESRERALSAQRIAVGTCHLPIRLTVTENITIRISNVSMETAEPAIHSICMSCGSVEGLLRTKEGAVDVLFSISDKLDMQTILKKLNDMLIDDCKWFAHLLPKTLEINEAKMADPQLWVGSQISKLIDGFRKQSDLERIYLEDLENLHHSVVHMRGGDSSTHL